MGDKNQYDYLAGQAQIIGTEYHNRELVDLGKELGRMINQIPYNDDRFYRVIVKSLLIKNKIEQITSHDQILDKIYELKNGGWSYELIKIKGNQVLIILDNWRTTAGNCEGKFTKEINQILKPREDLSQSAQKDYVDFGVCSTETVNNFDSKSEMLFSKEFHTHEDGYSIGFRDTELLCKNYFYDHL